MLFHINVFSQHRTLNSCLSTHDWFLIIVLWSGICSPLMARKMYCTNKEKTHVHISNKRYGITTRTVKNVQSRETNRVHKTKTSKAQARYTMCWTPLCANKHKQCKYNMSPPTNN